MQSELKLDFGSEVGFGVGEVRVAVESGNLIGVGLDR